jgi:hypothetical protein
LRRNRPPRALEIQNDDKRSHREGEATVIVGKGPSIGLSGIAQGRTPTDAPRQSAMSGLRPRPGAWLKRPGREIESVVMRVSTLPIRFGMAGGAFDPDSDHHEESSCGESPGSRKNPRSHPARPSVRRPTARTRRRCAAGMPRLLRVREQVPGRAPDWCRCSTRGIDDGPRR